MLPRRLERLNELLHQEISRLVLKLKDHRIGFVTITSVKAEQDLASARIFYSVLGTEEECEYTKKALNRAAPFIRHELGRLENFRRIPELHFIHDQTPARAARVFELLNQIQQEQSAAAPRRNFNKSRLRKTRGRKPRTY